MKRILSVGLIVFFVALAFSFINTNSTSLQELKADAALSCITEPNSDCVSNDKNIYVGYKLGK